MIVTILSSSASFKGVSYNTGKIDRGKGELMKVVNFGSLQALENLRPEDYKAYLKAISARNSRVKAPQFHAAISAKGRTYDKDALTEIAEQWMRRMGYENQPYLVVFHKDTANNHVHIVSTRIGRDGKKINSEFENIRALQNLNKVLGIDPRFNAQQDFDKALSYRFSTKAQFKMILENEGYTLRELDDKLELIKFGVKQGKFELSKVLEKTMGYQPDKQRLLQLKALFLKYGGVFDVTLSPNAVPMPGNYSQETKGFTSPLAQHLKEKFGIDLIFHYRDDKPPYGYSIIDRSVKAVYKGSEVMPLKELLAIKSDQKKYINEDELSPGNDPKPTANTADEKQYYAAILKAAIRNYPDLMQGLHHLGLNIIQKGNEFLFADYANHTFININELLDDEEAAEIARYFNGYLELENEVGHQFGYIPSVSISDDVDDEAIHGRNRRRKKHPRTNSR
jgi:hypothetical protein